MLESYSLFPNTIQIDPFDPYSPFKFLIFYSSSLAFYRAL